jgi:2-polyprenyl-3-methyl-5-hydroxy-6-metoxy-1,4-benzoquinol methylase
MDERHQQDATDAPRSLRSHWESVYQTKLDTEVSWHQEDPAHSRELITEFAPPEGSILDVGGGSSPLAGQLAALGYAVTAMDISAAAITRAKTQSGDVGGRIRWLVADVTTTPNLGTFDLWHDRAVFHFLTCEQDRAAYCSLLERTVRLGGHAVMATFALDGPAQCSGLPVQRYSETTLGATLGSGFELVRGVQHLHHTPWGSSQSFQFAVLRRC